MSVATRISGNLCARARWKSAVSRSGRGYRQSGFTLVELLVATTIAVFLLGGLFATLQSTRNAYSQQYQLAQLQDNERLAMTLITDVVESAGYYPSPQTYDVSLFMPSGGPWSVPGQAVLGTANTAAPGDTITIRYGAGPKIAGVVDNVYNCIGTQNSTGAIQTFVNTFKVGLDASGNSWLICNNGTADFQLVKGVTNLQILYGVQTTSGTGSCTDTYFSSAQMVASGTLWSSVCSVKVTLTFKDQVSLAKTAPVNVQRVIALMNTAGGNT